MTTEAPADHDWREDEFSLRDLAGILWRRKWTIASTAFLALLGSAVVTLLMPPAFEAEARVLVEEPTSVSNVMGQLTSLPSDLSQLLGGDPRTAAEMEILQSRPVAAAVVGPPGTSAVAPDEGLRRTVLVDDLDQQSRWTALVRALKDLGTPEGDLYVEVLRWDYPEKFLDPLRIEFLDATTVRISVDSWFGPSETIELEQGQPVQFDLATLVLRTEGDLTGRRFRVTVRQLQRAVNEFLSELVVEETDRGSNVLRIAFPDRNAERSARTVNALVRSYLAHNRTRFLTRASRSAGFVETEIERIREDLRLAEEDLQRFLDEAGPMVLPEAATTVLEQLVEVDLQRAQFELRAAAADEIVRGVREGTLSIDEITALEPYAAVATGASESSFIPALADLLGQRRALQIEHTDEWPELVELNALIDQRVEAIAVLLERQAWRDERLARDMESIVEQYAGQMEGMPAAQVEMVRHERRVRAFGEIYMFLVGQLEQTRFAETASVPNVEVIDWAVPPLELESPKLRLNLAVGLALGLLLGAGIAFAREFTRRPLLSASQLEIAARAPHLGDVPGETVARRRLAAADAGGALAEAYRALRDTLRHGVGSEGARTLAVTTGTRSEDASSVSMNLAIALARAGEKVLLVEGDARSPLLQEWLGAGEPGAPGTTLSQVLAGAPHQPSSTAQEGLHLLPQGTSDRHLSDLIATTEGREALRGLAATYSRVVLNAPPVLAGSEGPALAAAADATLVVGRARKSTVDELGETAQRLRLAGARIVGTILIDGGAT